jgi:hypothetical protein
MSPAMQAVRRTTITAVPVRVAQAGWFGILCGIARDAIHICSSATLVEHGSASSRVNPSRDRGPGRNSRIDDVVSEQLDGQNRFRSGGRFVPCRGDLLLRLTNVVVATKITISSASG